MGQTFKPKQHGRIEGMFAPPPPVVIKDAVDGPVHAQVIVELPPTARIQGDAHFAAQEKHQGALIAGPLRPIFGVEEKPY